MTTSRSEIVSSTRHGEISAESTSEPGPKRPSRQRKWIFRLLILLPLSSLLVLGIVLAVWAIPVFGPMHPETADLGLLRQWLVFRDFHQQSPEVQRELLERFTTLLGPDSGMKPEVNLSELEKKYSEDFGKEEGMADQNARLMVRLWFRERAKEYHSAGEIEKTHLLDQAAEEMDWWETFYFEYLEEVGKEAPSVVEMLGDLNQVMERIRQEVSPEEYEKVRRFKDQLQARLVWRRATKALKGLGLPLGGDPKEERNDR
jgi:hypothetical protein